MFKKQNSITYTFYYDLADAIQGQGGLELGSWKRAIGWEASLGVEKLQGQEHPAGKPAVQETGDVPARTEHSLSLTLLSQAKALLTSKPSVHLE